MAQKNESGRMIVVDADKLINWLSYAIKELREWNPGSEAAADVEAYLLMVIPRAVMEAK